MVACICAHGRDQLHVWSPTINAYILQNREKCIINQCNILWGLSLVVDSADEYAFEDTLRTTRVVLVYLLIYNAL